MEYQNYHEKYNKEQMWPNEKLTSVTVSKREQDMNISRSPKWVCWGIISRDNDDNIILLIKYLPLSIYLVLPDMIELSLIITHNCDVWTDTNILILGTFILIVVSL